MLYKKLSKILAIQHSSYHPEKAKNQSEDWSFMGAIGFEPTTSTV
jgi:hypothetical protein